MKIQIVGFSGSGKSTLAKKLAEFYKIPVLYLDNTKFYGDWQERTYEEQEAIVEDFMNKNDSWVIDGNYKKIAKRRFEECDLIIFLNFNRFFCYRQAKKRYKENKGTHRESCPCEEKFDKDFRRWILIDARKKDKVQKLKDMINMTKGERLEFKNRKQVNKYLESLGVK